MKYGYHSTFSGKHHVKGHRKRMHGGDHYKAKPSRVSYFASLRWIENKRKRIAKHMKATRQAS